MSEIILELLTALYSVRQYNLFVNHSLAQSLTIEFIYSSQNCLKVAEVTIPDAAIDTKICLK